MSFGVSSENFDGLLEFVERERDDFVFDDFLSSSFLREDSWLDFFDGLDLDDDEDLLRWPDELDFSSLFLSRRCFLGSSFNDDDLLCLSGMRGSPRRLLICGNTDALDESCSCLIE
jgi:hypothetical protein